MNGVIATIPRFQFSNALGVPLAGGTLATYLAGTTTPAKTYQDEALTIENTNPIKLDARGECVLWLDPAKSYKLVLKSVLGVTQWTQDNVSGAYSGHGERPVQHEVQTAAAGQKAFSLKKISYTPGISSLKVYVDGFRMSPGDFLETARDTVTFVRALSKDAEVLFEAGSGVNSQSSNDPSMIPYVPPVGPPTNVHDALTYALAQTGKTVRVSNYTGAVVHENFITAIQFIDGQGGGTLMIDGGVDYEVWASIRPAILANDLRVVFEPGTTVRAAAGLSSPVFDLRASDTAMTDRTLSIVSPAIDYSAGVSPPDAQGCSAISAQYFKLFTATGLNLYGGEDPSTAGGDSGITPINCDAVWISGGRIRGASDGGVYIGGDNTAGSGGDGITAIIEGVLFERCNNAVLAKRDLNHLRVTRCYITECNSGVITAEVTDPTYTNPGRRIDVEHNRFKKVTANLVRVRGPAKGRIFDNVLEDWGYRFDGTGPAGANGYALVVHGASGLDVGRNEFKIVDWPLNDQRAVLLDNVTLNGVLYTQGSHHFSCNSYRNVPRCIVEAAGGTASTYLNEYFEAIGTGKFSGLHLDSIVTFRELGKRGTFIRTNNLEFRAGQPAVFDSAVSVALSENDSGGTFTNVGAAAQVVYTLPAAAKGLTFEFICMDADGLKIQTTSNDVIRIAGSVSTNNGSATSTAVGTSIRITAVDSTNWIAQSASGAWALA